MIMSTKTVSVVMTTYNGELFLREQLDSILCQTYPIHELIVQDDCSTDNTVEIIKEYATRHPFIKLYVNEHNLGFNKNFKTAVMKATGDYVAIADQDDIWFPEKIEKQVQAIRDHDICCSPCIKGSTMENAHLYKYKFCFENQLFASIYGHTMLCQRSFIQNEEYWIPSIWYDWSLSIYAYLNNGVAVVNEPLNLHRQHEQEVSQVDYGSHNIFSPYINGYTKYRQLQKDSNWQLVYNLILTNTTDKQPLVHQFCKLLLKEGLLSLFRLCCLCLKHREKVYPTRQTHGIMGAVRGFFFPFIHAYYTNIYKNCL
jgi:glycosyltransferase involved in cell wall biosynthesis